MTTGGPEGDPGDSLAAEIAAVAALGIEERPAALWGLVRRLEEELDATEARPGGS